MAKVELECSGQMTCVVCGKSGANNHAFTDDINNVSWYNGASWHTSCFSVTYALREASKDVTTRFLERLEDATSN